MAGSRAYSLSEHELPCTSCISAETLDLPLPLTAQTSCPSRLEFRKALLTRLDLPIDSAKLHLPESPVLIRRLCAQLIDAFRICYMSDQDLYFADSLARELQRRTRQHRLALTKVKAEDGPNRVSAQQNVEVAQIGRSEASHTGRQVDDSQRECFPVLLDDPGLMEEWGLLAGCESPSNLRRALFELKSRLIELTSQSQLKPPQCRQADSKAGGSRTTASHLDNGILSVPKSCDPGSSSDASAIVQPYIRHLQHLINRFCAPANVVMNAEDTDVEFTRRYHDEAERLGVYVHPAVSVIPCGEAGRGLAAGQFIPAGTSLIEVPETAILNVYGALKDPVFGHIARFLLTLQPVQPRSEFQQGVPGGRPTAPEVCQKSPRGNEASRGGLLEGEGEVSGSNREPSSPGGAVRGIERRLMWPSKLDGGDGQDIGDFSASGCQERVSNEGIIFSASEPCPLGTPWVDTDTVCLFYFLFEVEKGDASHYRFFFQEMIPPPRDETQQPLIVGPPEVPEILGDTPLMRTIEDTHLKSFNLYRQLIPLLKETFASPGLSPALGETGSPLREQVSRYIDSLTLQKCIWAQSVMGSRAFSVKIPPPAVLPGWRLDTGLAEVEEDSQGGQGRLTNCLPGEEAAADGDNRRSEPEFSEARSGVYAKRVCIRQDDGEEDSRSGQDEKVEVRHESSRLENADEEETVVPFLPALRERCNNSPLYRVRVSSSCSPTADATERRSAEDGALVCVPDHPTSFLLFTDMMNHHVHAQCAFPYFDEQTRRACVVAQADIPAGAQLYIFYGPMQSWELLAHYGFTTNNFFSFGRGVSATATGTAGETGACCGDWSFTREREGNPYDTLTLSFEPPDDDPDEATRRLLLRLCEVPSEALLRTGAPHFSSRLLECLQISLHPDVDELVAMLPCAGFNERTATSNTFEQPLSATTGSSAFHVEAGASASSLSVCCHQRILAEYLNQKRLGPSCEPATQNGQVNGFTPSTPAEGAPSSANRGRMGESKIAEAGDRGGGAVLPDTHRAPVTQTAHELLQARGEVLDKLEFWRGNEAERPHWYDAWGNRAELFLKNQIALFARIYELFSSPPVASGCSRPAY